MSLASSITCLFLALSYKQSGTVVNLRVRTLAELSRAQAALAMTVDFDPARLDPDAAMEAREAEEPGHGTFTRRELPVTPLDPACNTCVYGALCRPHGSLNCCIAQTLPVSCARCTICVKVTPNS